MSFPGEIRFDEDRTAHVVPRVPGVVEAVQANLGETVKKGQVLAVIASQQISDLRSEQQADRQRDETPSECVPPQHARGDAQNDVQAAAGVDLRREEYEFGGPAEWVAGNAYAQSTAAPAKPAATDTEITAAFTKADKNADGKLSKDEATTLPALAAKFDSADADKDGTISAAEFGKAMKM